MQRFWHLVISPLVGWRRRLIAQRSHPESESGCQALSHAIPLTPDLKSTAGSTFPAVSAG